MPKRYRFLNKLPKGQASANLIPGCLVLEGGAFRGLYTQGFLDAMMTAGLNLKCVIGVSAGALSAISYVSGQIGRSGRINLTYRHDSHYVGLLALLRSHSPLDIGFLTEDRTGERDVYWEPLDQARFDRPEQRLVAVATNCETGEAEYFEKGKCDIMRAIRASATMPYISPMVDIDGTPYLDGGCACKIPYQWAIDQGYEKIVVIRTREIGFHKAEAPIQKAEKAPHRFYKHYPKLADDLTTSDHDYNVQVDEIEALHAAGRLLRVAPSEPVTVARVEGDMDKLGHLYWLGVKDGIAQVPAIKAYLYGDDK